MSCPILLGDTPRLKPTGLHIAMLNVHHFKEVVSGLPMSNLFDEASLARGSLLASAFGGLVLDRMTIRMSPKIIFGG